MSNNFLEVISNNTKLIETIYIDLAQPGVREVGQALETVLALSNTILLPIKLLNEKVKINFNRNMELYKSKMKDIESDKIFEVPPEIGIPILDKFTYISDNEVSKLFVNLLASASNVETIKDTYPKFLHIINCLSVDEARILNYLYNRNTYIPTLEFILRIKEEDEFTPNIGLRKYKVPTDTVLSNILTALEKKINLLFPENMNMYLENLENLGILKYEEIKDIKNESEYNELQMEYNYGNEYISFVKNSKTDSIIYKPGRFNITKYGVKFLTICCEPSNE